MTKKILKGLGVASLLAALAVVSVPADAADLKCQVPFSFTVNGKTLAAGTYDVSTTAAMLSIRRFGGEGAFAVTNAVESRNGNDVKLVFHKYGSRYLLREVWVGGGMGRVLPPSRLERELAAAARNGQVAAGFERIVIPVL
jgi:hypothetical protein